MAFLKKNKKPVSENDTFITLIAVAREDAAFRHQLIGILGLDPFNRKSALHSIADNMRLQEAPNDLINAVESLTEDSVAERALELIQNAK